MGRLRFAEQSARAGGAQTILHMAAGRGRVILLLRLLAVCQHVLATGLRGGCLAIVYHQHCHFALRARQYAVHLGRAHVLDDEPGVRQELLCVPTSVGRLLRGLARQ